jgi:hypothetical protein
VRGSPWGLLDAQSSDVGREYRLDCAESIDSVSRRVGFDSKVLVNSCCDRLGSRLATEGARDGNAMTLLSSTVREHQPIVVSHCSATTYVDRDGLATPKPDVATLVRTERSKPLASGSPRAGGPSLGRPELLTDADGARRSGRHRRGQWARRGASWSRRRRRHLGRAAHGLPRRSVSAQSLALSTRVRPTRVHTARDTHWPRPISERKETVRP